MKQQTQAAEFMPYSQRQYAYHGLITAADMQLKLYSIATQQWANSDPLDLAVARQYINTNLPAAINAEGGSHGCGFVIVHFGEGSVWILSHWWAHADICCQQMAHSDAAKQALQFHSIGQRPLHACVWEHQIIHFEYQAWINTMLCAAPDKSAYLSRNLENGAY